MYWFYQQYIGCKMGILDFRTVFRFYEQYADFTNCVSVKLFYNWFIEFQHCLLVLRIVYYLLVLLLVYTLGVYKKVLTKNLKKK